MCFVVYLTGFKEASEGFWRTWKDIRTRLWMRFLFYKERKRELHLLWLTSLLQTWLNINVRLCVLHSFHYPSMHGPHWTICFPPHLLSPYSVPFCFCRKYSRRSGECSPQGAFPSDCVLGALEEMQGTDCLQSIWLCLWPTDWMGCWAL